ncbi:MAG: phospholipase D family protein [Methyloversatilis sp.]|nr:phospholipase D family protein [Methyloversatilis sp.]
MRSELRGALFAATMLAAMPLSAGRTLPAEGKVEVAFAPWDDVERLVMDQIDGARQAVYVQAYTLTSRNIVKTLIAAAERGVKVEVVADRDKVLKDERSALPRAAGNGVKVWLDGDHAAAHSKVMIIDPDGKEPVVVTGSYNFSYSAKSENAENVMVLSGHRALAQTYLDNWKRHRAKSMSFADAVVQTQAKDAAGQ